MDNKILYCCIGAAILATAVWLYYKSHGLTPLVPINPPLVPINPITQNVCESANFLIYPPSVHKQSLSVKPCVASPDNKFLTFANAWTDAVKYSGKQLPHQEACEDLCNNDPDCKAYMYEPARGYCYFGKEAPKGLYGDNNNNVGVKYTLNH